MQRRSFLVAPIALLALAASSVGLSSASAAGTPVDIDIVAINDFHGRIEEGPAPGTGQTTSQSGAAVLSTMVQSYRNANPNTTFVAAGDLIGASTFTSFIQQDQPTIDALNAIGLDTSSFGNHEFDQGRTDVDTRIEPATNWNYTASNLYNASNGSPAYPGYYLREFDGVKVGFIGAVTEELPSLVSPAGIESLVVGGVVESVNRVAGDLTDDDPTNGDADVLVLLIHEGAVSTAVGSVTDDSAFGQIVKGVDVDAIVSAHTHLPYDHEVPIGPDAQVGPVISTGQYGERFGHLNLQVDPETKEIVLFDAEVLDLWRKFAPDPVVAQIVTDAVAVAQVKGSVPLGEITADFNRAIVAAGTENRGGESTLGNFVADVQLWAGQQWASEDETRRVPVLSFMNPGGLRADLKYAVDATHSGDADGLVTYQEAAVVQPFANTLVLEDLTGDQVRQALEQQWQPTGSSRPFLKLGIAGGLEYTFDAAAPVGSRVSNITIDGVPLDPAMVYPVVLNSFLAAGGDNFPALSGASQQDTGLSDLQGMVDYLAANPELSPDLAQRSIGVQLSPPDSDGYSSGDQVTLTLSSLLMSNGGPADATVEVFSGGALLGSSAIDPTLTPATPLDESGKATVAVTLPATAAGTLVLTVAVPAAETSIDVPIPVTQQAITNLTPPVISGQARVGRTLTASDGTWSVLSPTLAYQWNRDGVPIPDATGASYVGTGADAGADLTVTVTASKEGNGDGTATSAATSIPKADSDTTARLSHIFVSSNGTVTVRVDVDGQYGIPATGEVTVYDGRSQIATATLGADGKVTLTLPKFSRGIHLISVRYAGNDQLRGSTSFPRVLLVY
jgi:5'-nucleotidase